MLFFIAHFRWIRAEHYRYEFTKFGSRAAKGGAWWERRKIGSYMPPVSLDNLQQYLKSMGWQTPRLTKRKKGKK